MSHVSNESTLPDALNHFADALTQSTQATQDLASAVQASEAARKKRNVLVAIAVGATLILIILNLVLAVSSFSTQARIKDCTDPAGECAQRSQANTAKVIVGIAQNNLTITWAVNRCALDDPSPAKLDECVNDTLKAVKAGTLKAPQVPQ
jgi:hypothetical protein